MIGHPQVLRRIARATLAGGLLSIVASCYQRRCAHNYKRPDRDGGNKPHPATPTAAVATATSPAASTGPVQPGTVVAWGLITYGQVTVPAGLSSVTAIAAGDWHSLALKSDGTVVAWGDNGNGNTVPASLSSVSAIAGGGRFCLAIVHNP
jgi:hypothetical protein